MWYFPKSRLSNRGLIRQWFILLQLYYIMVKWRTLSEGLLPLLLSLVFLFSLSLKYLRFLSLISTLWLLLILYRAFYFYISTNLFIFKSIITFSPSPVFTRWLYALYKLTLLIIFNALNLILNYSGFKLTVAVYRGLFTK
jgi:hypothetical protein